MGGISPGPSRPCPVGEGALGIKAREQACAPCSAAPGQLWRGRTLVLSPEHSNLLQ